MVNKLVVFDASESIDKETQFDRLLFKWDFDGDGKFDTDAGKFSKVSHVYPVAGNYLVILEVEDENHRTYQVSRIVMVHDICPSDMISVNGQNGEHFCIDVYEWPNLQNRVPQTHVSWVEAKMSCIDAGKRLCSANEWEIACQGLTKSVYPYGNKYDLKRCPAEGKNIYKSGTFKECNEFKIQDMIGNLWEWVEDKHGEYPQMYGGSYTYGKNAHCNLSADGFIASRSGEVGFRCCK
jgi:formylglycine-generating enzyme required for sulfatase activity